jgi:hypothetical protein
MKTWTITTLAGVVVLGFGALSPAQSADLPPRGPAPAAPVYAPPPVYDWGAIQSDAFTLPIFVT